MDFSWTELVRASSQVNKKRYTKTSAISFCVGILFLGIAATAGEEAVKVQAKSLIFGLFGLGFGCYSLYMMMKQNHYSSDPLYHPFFESLQGHFGEDCDLQEIENELREGGIEVDHLILSERFLIDTIDLALLPVDRLVWIQDNFALVFSTLRVYCSDGKVHSVRCQDQATMNDTLAKLKSHLPELHFGNTQELLRTWQKDRQKMIDVVAQNRAEKVKAQR